jgi:hypothetical protein
MTARLGKKKIEHSFACATPQDIFDYQLCLIFVMKAPFGGRVALPTTIIEASLFDLEFSSA